MFYVSQTYRVPSEDQPIITVTGSRVAGSPGLRFRRDEYIVDAFDGGVRVMNEGIIITQMGREHASGHRRREQVSLNHVPTYVWASAAQQAFEEAGKVYLGLTDFADCLEQFSQQEVSAP